jgi:hypothetical protein
MAVMSGGNRGAATAAAVITLLLLAACGGRVSRPVAATHPYDDQLSCDHLHAERTVNESRIADLRNERGDAISNNVGKLVATPMLPLFMDFSGVENKEVAALDERDKVLDTLIAAKCQPAKAATAD